MSKRSNVNNIKENVKSVIVDDISDSFNEINMSNQVPDVMAVDVDDLPCDSARMRAAMLESEREMEMLLAPTGMQKRVTAPPQRGPGGPKLLMKE